MRSTTANNEPREEEKETFLQSDEAGPWQQAKSHGPLRHFVNTWWRIVFEAVLVITIVGLLFSRELAAHVRSNGGGEDASHSEDKEVTARTPVPTCTPHPPPLSP